MNGAVSVTVFVRDANNDPVGGVNVVRELVVEGDVEPGENLEAGKPQDARHEGAFAPRKRRSHVPHVLLITREPRSRTSPAVDRIAPRTR